MNIKHIFFSAVLISLLSACQSDPVAEWEAEEREHEIEIARRCDDVLQHWFGRIQAVRYIRVGKPIKVYDGLGKVEFKGEYFGDRASKSHYPLNGKWENVPKNQYANLGNALQRVFGQPMGTHSFCGFTPGYLMEIEVAPWYHAAESSRVSLYERGTSPGSDWWPENEKYDEDEAGLLRLFPAEEVLKIRSHVKENGVAEDDNDEPYYKLFILVCFGCKDMKLKSCLPVAEPPGAMGSVPGVDYSDYKSFEIAEEVIHKILKVELKKGN